MSSTLIKVLIVDDSQSMRLEIKQVLERHLYSVIDAKDGMDGLTKLHQNADIKLIISDFNMPNMDGLTMCEQIRKEAIFDHLPILLLTSETNRILKERGKKAGVLAWMTKPMKEKSLISTIKKVLSHA